MRAVIQRVTRGEVSVDHILRGQIDLGLVVLLAVTHTDTLEVADTLAAKTVHLRIFEDDQGKMNLSVLDVLGAVLIVSQFTLYADTKGARRPNFMAAARPEVAEPLIERYISQVRAMGVKHVETGVFGAMMQVTLVNDGPVTIILDTDA